MGMGQIVDARLLDKDLKDQRKSVEVQLKELGVSRRKRDKIYSEWHKIQAKKVMRNLINFMIGGC